MDKKKIKFITATIIIVLSVGYLVMTGITSTSVYYLTVEEFIDKKNTLYEEGVRIQGKVVGGSIDKDTMSLKLNFDIADEKKPGLTLHVNYKGIIPDLFEAGREVVVEGKYTKDNIFLASTLLTSCPSKYEASKESNTNSSKEGVKL